MENRVPTKGNEENSAQPELIKQSFTEKQLEKLISVFSPVALVKYPYFVSASRRSRQKEISFEETLRDGTLIKWRVKAPDYLPGEMEFKIWCWILHKISEAKKPLPDNFFIPYTLYEIAKYWGIKIGGNMYRLIYKAIENLRNTDIHYWIQEPVGKKEDLNFKILGSRAGQGSEKCGEILNKNAIFLDIVLIRLLNKGPIKPSDLEALKKLADSNLIAARLYELLGWRFYLAKYYGRNSAIFMYSELVQRIGLKKEIYISDAKDQFRKAHNQLKDQNIIAEYPVWQENCGEWKIIYNISGKLADEIDTWVKRKKAIEVIPQDEDINSKIEYALEEITEFLGKDEKHIFKPLVKKVLEKNKNSMNMIFKAISEAKQEQAGTRLRNKAAYLTGILKKYI